MRVTYVSTLSNSGNAESILRRRPLCGTFRSAFGRHFLDTWRQVRY